MAFYDRKTNGSMCTRLIHTIATNKFNIAKACTDHEEKVTLFTAEHIVWFSTTQLVETREGMFILISDIKFTP